MGFKFNPVDVAEIFHFRSHHRVWTTADGHDYAGVVNNTPRTDSIHKLKGFVQKHLAFKAGETGIILNEQFPAVGKHK